LEFGITVRKGTLKCSNKVLLADSSRSAGHALAGCRCECDIGFSFQFFQGFGLCVCNFGFRRSKVQDLGTEVEAPAFRCYAFPEP